jgi:anaerobic carbon-monoxide dehydrogenase iron sulfur subunit
MIRTKPKLCSGCRLCTLACSVKHYGIFNPRKAKLKITPYENDTRYKIKICVQCGKCAQVCPVEAIREIDGNYILDEKECTLCGSCAEICPIDAIFIYGDNEIYEKCNSCGECVLHCPHDVLSLYTKKGSTI